MKANCKNCRFWSVFYDPEEKENNLGQCHRYAPNPLLLPGGEIDKVENDPELIFEVFLPETGATHWCGDWELRRNDAPDEKEEGIRREGVKVFERLRKSERGKA